MSCPGVGWPASRGPWIPVVGDQVVWLGELTHVVRCGRLAEGRVVLLAAWDQWLWLSDAIRPASPEELAKLQLVDQAGLEGL